MRCTRCYRRRYYRPCRRCCRCRGKLARCSEPASALGPWPRCVAHPWPLTCNLRRPRGLARQPGSSQTRPGSCGIERWQSVAAASQKCCSCRGGCHRRTPSLCQRARRASPFASLAPRPLRPARRLLLVGWWARGRRAAARARREPRSLCTACGGSSGGRTRPTRASPLVKRSRPALALAARQIMGDVRRRRRWCRGTCGAGWRGAAAAACMRAWQTLACPVRSQLRPSGRWWRRRGGCGAAWLRCGRGGGGDPSTATRRPLVRQPKRRRRCCYSATCAAGSSDTAAAAI